MVIITELLYSNCIDDDNSIRIIIIIVIINVLFKTIAMGKVNIRLPRSI